MTFNKFKECFEKSKLNINTWKTDSEYQINKIKILVKDLEDFEKKYLSDFEFKAEFSVE